MKVRASLAASLAFCGSLAAIASSTSIEIQERISAAMPTWNTTLAGNEVRIAWIDSGEPPEVMLNGQFVSLYATGELEFRSEELKTVVLQFGEDLCAVPMLTISVGDAYAPVNAVDLFIGDTRLWPAGSTGPTNECKDAFVAGGGSLLLPLRCICDNNNQGGACSAIQCDMNTPCRFGICRWVIWNCTTLLGDMNCDGVVSVGDIGPFTLAVTDPDGYGTQFPDCCILNADINMDGVVSVGDISYFIALLSG